MGLKVGEYVTEVDETFQKHVAGEFAKRTPGNKAVMVASLTLTMVPQEAYGTHCSNFYQLGRDCPDYDFAFITPRRMAIDSMRNMVVELAIKGGFDYLYFFDDDTINDKNVLGRLLPKMEEFNAISASYYVRGEPFSPMLFCWIDPSEKEKGFKLLEEDPKPDEDLIVRENVAAVGCGCTLFRVDDFKKIPFPWFKTGLHHTEDAFWFAKAHHTIPDYKVGMDFSIHCGHLCNPVYVDANNVHIVRKFHEELRKVGGLSQ